MQHCSPVDRLVSPSWCVAHMILHPCNDQTGLTTPVVQQKRWTTTKSRFGGEITREIPLCLEANPKQDNSKNQLGSISHFDKVWMTDKCTLILTLILCYVMWLYRCILLSVFFTVLFLCFLLFYGLNAWNKDFDWLTDCSTYSACM